MIIRFELENWMSYRDRAELLMSPTREHQHKERLPYFEKYSTRILPIAAIYGGNASGKSNLFAALNFVKHFVVNGSRPDSVIRVDPFLLDPDSKNRPTAFRLEILVDEIIYEYSFSVTLKKVIEEKLIRINSASETLLFHRHNGELDLDPSLEKDSSLRIVFQGTQDNLLFLTNSFLQKRKEFQPVFNWFKDTLHLIAPDTRFQAFEQYFDINHPHQEAMNNMLRMLDTGVHHLGSDEIPIDGLPLPSELLSDLSEHVQEGQAARLVSGDDRYVFNRKNGKLYVRKLFTYHSNVDDANIKFEIHQESDGTKRLLQLLPVFLELIGTKSDKVYVVDEFERSLHTLLTRKLIESYLNTCSANTRKQMLFTTHDVLLMDQQLLRRDEMWITERDPDGGSSLLSFSEFKDVRKDKDVRKSYLQGRLGGIPHLSPASMLRQQIRSSDMT